MDITKYHAVEDAERVHIIKTKEELESFKHRLELDPNKIFRAYVTVKEDSERSRIIIAKEDNETLTFIRVHNWKATTISLEKSYKRGDYKLINLKSLIGYFRDNLRCSYTQQEVVTLCGRDWDTKEKRSRPIPYVLYAIQDKASTYQILAWPEALEHLFTESSTPKALGQGTVKYSKIEFDNNSLQRFSKLYPQLITKKLEQAQEAIDYINANVKARVILNSDSTIEPTKDTSKLTTLKIIKANTPTPKANELKSEGSHNFLIGNVLDTEVQMLAEYSNQLDVQYYLDRIDTDPDCYRLFVYPEAKKKNYGGYYRSEHTFKLFKRSFADYTIKETYNLQPIEELPVPSDIPRKSKNPVVAAIKYYLETGKAISYVHFR